MERRASFGGVDPLSALRSVCICVVKWGFSSSLGQVAACLRERARADVVEFRVSSHGGGDQ